MERSHTAVRAAARLLFSIVALLVAAAHVEAQQKTTVSDNLTSISGTLTGTLTVSADETFTTVDGFTILAGTKTTVTLGSLGHFSVDLPANIGSSPWGTSYSVDYATNKAKIHETWVVPVSSSPVLLSAVRVLWLKASSVLIPSTQFQPPPGCLPMTSGTTLRWTLVGWSCAFDNIATININLENPTAADSGKFQWKPGNGLTLTRISCDVDGGSVSINFELRTQAAPNSPGTLVLSVPLVCGPVTTDTFLFANAHIGPDVPVALAVSTTTGAPGIVRIHAKYQLD